MRIFVGIFYSLEIKAENTAETQRGAESAEIIL